MGKSKADQIIQAYDNGMSEMSSLHSLVRVLGRYFKPDYSDLQVDPIESELVLPNTSTGIIAQQKFVAGLYSNTISMGRGTLNSADPAKRDKESVKRFYGSVGEMSNDIVKRIFPRPYRESLEDTGLSSVGVFYVYFDEDTNKHEIIPYNPMDCVWYEDSSGRANKIYRGFEFTADQAIEFFGFDNVSERIQKASKDDSKANEKHMFIHCMRPRKDRDKNKKDTMNMPFESIYVEKEGRKIVKEEGTTRFRYVVTVMLKRRGLRTGYSPAMHSLPSMRTLVRGIDDFYDAIEFRTNPVIFMGDRESVDNAKSLTPGDVRYARLDKGAPFLYGKDGDPATVDAMNEHLRKEIRELHFLDLFQALEEFKQGERTAFEVAKIIAEKINLIAPIIEPIKATFAMLFEIIAEDIMQHGLIEEPIPAEVAGDEFRVVYTNRLDAQTSGVDTENLLFAIQEMTQAEQMMAQGKHTSAMLEIENILRAIIERRNLETDLSKTSDDYNKTLEQMDQAQQQAMAAQANAEAAAKRDVNQAPEEGSEADIIRRAQAGASL